MTKAQIQEIIDIKDALIQSMLDVAAAQSWNDIEISDIIDHAQCDNDMARVLFSDKQAVLSAYGAQIDQRLADDLKGSFGETDDDKDRLFDVMMERFEILNENRAGVVSILNAVTMDPKQGIKNLPQLCQSVTNMVDIAGVGYEGWKNYIKIPVLTGVYLKSLRTWVNDNSDDMAATMASLDKGLGYLSRIKS
jgi:ubiquinone biosynthesis protein COQ9